MNEPTSETTVDIRKKSEEFKDFAAEQCAKQDVKPESVCAEADRIVASDRGNDYGRPIDDFSKTAVLWGVILGIEITPEQVAMCMAQVKVSRELNKHKRDNLVDLIGYTKCLDMVIADRAKRDAEGWDYNRIIGKWIKPGSEEPS